MATPPQLMSPSPIPGVKTVLAVASGKGGVGKSAVAVMLSLALAQGGVRVGMLDADIYGPSLPTMLGVKEAPESDGKRLFPAFAHGVWAMSMGFLVEPDMAMIWRGPMATQALSQLAFQTAWPELDLLVVDLPPGTGDIQLTLVQRIELNGGAIVVTTPQALAVADARRAVAMFRKVEAKVLGIVENMSFFRCPQCSHEEALFGSGGGEALALEAGVPLLAKLPLDAAIREGLDAGVPLFSRSPHDPRLQGYRELASRLAQALGL